MANKIVNFVYISCAVLACLVVGATGGLVTGVYQERIRAMDAGAGKFVADPRTGEVSFVYGKE